MILSGHPGKDLWIEAGHLNLKKKEIVEFGIVSFENFNSKKILKKNFHFKTKSEISNYFTQLTKITKEYNCKFGKDFNFNFIEINRLMQKSKVILCNGLDKEVLIKNFKLRNKKIPLFTKKIKNISPIFSNLFHNRKKHVVSSELPNILNIKNNIKNKHRAADDAYSIFLVLKHLINNKKINLLDLLS